MKRLLSVLSDSVLFGVVFGTCIGIYKIAIRRYLDHGLTGLALEAWSDAVWRYLLVALASGALAQLLGGAGRGLAARFGEWGRGLLGLVVFLCAALPVWLWFVFRDRESLSINRSWFVIGGAMVLVFHLLVYAWGRYRGGFPAVGLWGRGVASALALLLAIGLGLGKWTAAPEGSPNILIIVMDTVRADRMSSYGYSRPTTPELDAFGRDAIRYTQFQSTSSWTVPSHASLFTGLYPIRHGTTQEHLWLGTGFATLAEVLSNSGYRTWGASQNPFVGKTFNLAQGFEEFIELYRLWQNPTEFQSADAPPHLATAAFQRFLTETERDRPFFAFLNYIDAHLPLVPPHPHVENFQRPGTDLEHALNVGRENWAEFYVGKVITPGDLQILSDLYDAEIAYMSHSIGQLLDALRRDGRFHDTLIIITSDHGEHFGENGHLGHLFSLYKTSVQIPLWIRPPGASPAGDGSARVDDRSGQLLDLFPTVLSAAGIPTAHLSHQGMDLLAGPERQAIAGRDAIFSEYYFPEKAFELFDPDEYLREDGRLAPYGRRLRALEMEGWRLIWSSNGDHELYDLRRDPGELDNRYDSEPRLARHLLDRLETAVASYRDSAEPAGQSAPAPELDDQTREALRELGYLR